MCSPLLGANPLLLEWIPFQKGLLMQESKQEIKKDFSLDGNDGVSTKCVVSP